VPIKDYFSQHNFCRITHACQVLSEGCGSCDTPDVTTLPAYAMVFDLDDEHDPKLVLADAGGELADGAALTGVTCFDIHGTEGSSGWCRPKEQFGSLWK